MIAENASGSEKADIYYGTGKEAEVDFSDFDEDLLIDLNNSGALGNTTAALYGIKKVTGAKGGDNILAGQDGKSNILVGGADGDDTLTGGSGENTFYFGKGEGRDTITKSNIKICPTLSGSVG